MGDDENVAFLSQVVLWNEESSAALVGRFEQLKIRDAKNRIENTEGFCEVR